MMPPPFFSHLVVLGLLWWFVMRHDAGPSRGLASPHQPSPSGHGASAPATPSRFLASPASPPGPPGSRRTRTPPNRPVARHPASYPRGDGRARGRPRSLSAHSRTGRIRAGWGSASSAPTVPPTVAPGASGSAPAGAAPARRPMAPRCMASAWRPRRWGGRWAGASVPWPAGLRSIPPPSCTGWARARRTPRPARALSSTTDAAPRGHGMRFVPACGLCRRARSARRRPARADRGPHPGGGRRSSRSPSGGGPSTAASAPGRWRRAWSTRSSRGWRPAVGRAASPRAARSPRRRG
jgi:hypothetical protein